MNLLRFGAPALRALSALLFVLPALVLPSMVRAQNSGSVTQVTGTITDALTGMPVAGVLVQVAGSMRRAETNASGHFVINNVRTGLFRLEASKYAFAMSVKDNISLQRGQTTVVNFTITANSNRNSALVQSATLQPLIAANAPFAVDHILISEMPVPAANIADMLAGKAAGVQLTRVSGAPGADVSVRLRAASSLYRTASPLFVVDGVVLNESFPLTTQDIEALGVESIEILRGGTASALYGARALDGVIAIKTNRGNAARQRRPQFTLRNEVGRDFAGDWIDERLAHPYRVNTTGQYVSASGQVVSRADRVLQPNGIAENRYVVPTYNHGEQLFRGNVVNNQTLSVQQNSSTTNYNFSYSRNRQPGIVPNADGYTRQSVRANIDQRVTNRLQLGISAAHTGAEEEPAALQIFDLLNLDADVNLRAPDATGLFPYVLTPDNSNRVLNPLVAELLGNDQVRRNRTLVSGTASFHVLDWLTLDALASTDRATRRERNDFYPDTAPGVITAFRIKGDSALSERYQYGASSRRAWGALTGKLALRGESQYLRNSFDEHYTVVKGIAVPSTGATNFQLKTRGVTALLGNTNLDYAGKYFADIVFRRERNSNAFGTKGGPSTFIRAGAAWFMNDEPWFRFDNLSLFKLRYSVSSARTVPLLAPAYVPIGSSVAIPKHDNDSRIEQEIGIDVGFGQRLNASLTYAPFSAKGNVLTGFAGANADLVPAEGQLKGSSIEATLEARLVASSNGFRWNMLVTGSRERSRIAEFHRTCFSEGTQRFCSGASIGEIWVRTLVTEKSGLRSVHANSQSAFDINDDGFVVPVGAGNSWRDGKAKSLWGTTVSIDGRSYPWGLPIAAVDTLGTLQESLAGNSVPGLRFGWQNSIGYKGIHFYTQFTGQLGGQGYNNTKQILYESGRHADVDQSSKPDELRKSVAYYRAVAGGNSGYLKNFVESASAIRLAEASMGYSLDARRFAFVRRVGAERIQLDLIGRNLFNVGGGSGIPGNLQFGDPILNPGYPLARTFTFATALTF